MIKRKKIKVGVFLITSIFLVSNFFINTFNVRADEVDNNFIIQEENVESYDIANGINYSSKQVQIKQNDVNLKERVNIIQADLKNENLDIIISKGQNSVKGLEKLTSQIDKLRKEGKNVVAGINGDMFSTTTFIPIGPQVQDGRLLVNYLDKSQEKELPIFIMDKQGNVSIENLEFSGSITDGLNDEIKIDTVNRVPHIGKIQVFTREYSVDGKVELSNLNNTAIGIVVKNIDTPIKLGVYNEGVVGKIIKGNKDYVLNDDEVLITAEGANAAKLLKYYSEGSMIMIYCDFNKDNIKNAIGGYTYLVKDGEPQTAEQMIERGASKNIVNSTKKARTALGITEDDKVICITVDGGEKSYNISDGMSLPQFAKLLKSYNVVDAISLDGGGSTQMNIRRFGESNCSCVNVPSDGTERRISNAVLFVDNSPRTNILGHLDIGKDIVIYKNSKYTFNVKGEDTNFYPYPTENLNVNWSCDSKIGTIDENGVFTAKNTNAEGYVTAESNGVKDSVKVKVINDIPVLDFKDKTSQYVCVGDSKQFEIEAKDDNGNNVIINNQSIQWKTVGNIGNIVSNGLSASLTAVNRLVSGKVVASIGNKSCTLDVTVGRKYSVVDNFETLDNKRYNVDGEVGGVGAISNQQHKSGRYSYRIIYDYKNWSKVYNGTINLNPTYVDKNGKDIKKQFTSIAVPKKLGMWVYGDGKAPWMRAILKDEAGNSYTVNFVNRVTWKGWKFVSADIPTNITSPVTISRIYFVELNKDSNNKGIIYIDDIRFMY